MNYPLESHLKQIGERRVLDRLRSLSPPQRAELIAQLEAIDSQFWRELETPQAAAMDWRDRASQASSPPAIRLGDAQSNSKETRSLGAEALASGKVAAVMVAGGQGTRLGFPQPKGMYPIGPVSRRTLFQIHVDRLRAIARRYSARIPLLVMTSPATHEQTIRYFQAHDYLGLSPHDFGVFCQKSLPAIDVATGELLFESPSRLSLHPDGHGGMLPALAASGWLGELQSRGVQHLFYFQVDNPLTQIADPLFLGHHLLAQSEVTTQVVAKRSPAERVGNVVSIEGRMEVIEYIHLDPFPDLASRTAPDGSLQLWAGNLAVHAFSLEFLARVAQRAESLPLHRSRKKVPYLAADGRWVEPTSENAYKFERFVFDLLPLADRSLAVEVDRQSHFAPVKNAKGADSADSSREAMVGLSREWLASAGVSVAPGVPVEISPLYALDAAELRERYRGLAIESPCFLA